MDHLEARLREWRKFHPARVGHHVFLHFVETVTTMLLRLGLVGLGDVEFSVGKDDIFR